VTVSNIKTTTFSKQAHEADQPAAQARRIDCLHDADHDADRGPYLQVDLVTCCCVYSVYSVYSVYNVHTAACARPRVAHARGAYGSTAWIHRAGYPCALPVVLECTQLYRNRIIKILSCVPA
jgi:hypothetical protein